VVSFVPWMVGRSGRSGRKQFGGVVRCRGGRRRSQCIYGSDGRRPKVWREREREAVCGSVERERSGWEAASLPARSTAVVGGGGRNLWREREREAAGEWGLEMGGGGGGKGNKSRSCFLNFLIFFFFFFFFFLRLNST
jgi:hypothetical protein